MMPEMMETGCTDENQLQIKLITKQEKCTVPDTPLSVQANVTRATLNDLLKQLLAEQAADEDTCSDYKQFDFLINGELLRVALNEHLQERDSSTEALIEIEYVEATPPPEPLSHLLLNDWVSSAQCQSDSAAGGGGCLIATGSYDFSVNISAVQPDGTVGVVSSAALHTNIVKSVRWLGATDHLVSVSHDTNGILWRYHRNRHRLVAEVYMRGHERGIDCVAVSPNVTRLATGGWDTHLKIWSANATATNYDEPMDEAEEEPARKKAKAQILNRTPLNTLKGHKEAISDVAWLDDYTVCTASMDHIIKVWDAELCGIKSEIVGQKAFMSISWSPLNRLLLAASADRHIRLYDPRTTDGTICKTTLTSHKLWVSSVCWSTYDGNLFVSGSYDSQVKMWDVRSTKAPLYDLQGHDGQVLCVDWTTPQHIVSGGCDNKLFLFKNNTV